MKELLSKQTEALQQQLVEFCRTGENAPTEGITPERLPEYRRLVFSITKDALKSTYPLTKNLLTEKEWTVLVHDYFQEHTCAHPQVWRMPEELIDFVASRKKTLIHRYPHLLELLDLEWKEVVYYMMPDKPYSTARTEDFWNSSWNWNPEMELLQFAYPVHLKNAKRISRSDKGAYFCLVYRQPEIFKVKFMNLSPFLAELLQTMWDTSSSPCDVLSPNFPDPTSLQAIKTQLESFFKKLEVDGAVR